MGWILDGIFDWLAEKVLDVLTSLISVITTVMLTTPDVTVLPQVQAMTAKSVFIVDTVFVLAFVAAGALTMFAGGDEHARYTAKDLLPRCVVGFIAAHFSQLVASQLIELANALTAALTQVDAGPDGGLAGMKNSILATQDTAGALFFVVCVTIIAVLLAMTTFSMISRFAVVLVLTTIAPIALACHALPQTDPAARLWWRAYIGVLAVAPVQGLFLAAGQWFLTDPRTMLTLIGLPPAQTGIVSLFVAMVMLWTAVRVPSIMRRLIASPAANNNRMLGAVVRVVAVQAIGRNIPGLGRLMRR